MINMSVPERRGRRMLRKYQPNKMEIWRTNIIICSSVTGSEGGECHAVSSTGPGKHYSYGLVMRPHDVSLGPALSTACSFPQ